MTRLIRPVLVTIVCLAAFLAPATVAYALWSTTATGNLNVTTASATPGMPTNFACTRFANNNVVDLSWTGGTGATGYKIYGRTGTTPSFTYTPVQTLTAATATTTDVNRASDFTPSATTATLIIRAVNGVGESPDSNAITVNFTATPQSCS